MEWTKYQDTHSVNEAIDIAGNFFEVIVVKHSFVEVIVSKTLGKTVQLQCTVSLGKPSGALIGSVVIQDATHERQMFRGCKSVKGVSCNTDGRSWIFLLMEVVPSFLSSTPSSTTRK